MRYPGSDYDGRAFALVRVVLWLKKKDFGLSFLLTLATFVALGFFSEYFPRQWATISHVSDTVEDVGWRIGTMLLPNYSVRGTESFYLAAMSPILADFVVCWFLWYVAVRIFRGRRSNPEENLSAGSGLG